MHKKVLEFNATQRTKAVPGIRTGDTVRVHRKIVEGDKERVQVFEGLVIAMKGGQSSSPTLTVRKSSFGIGVELILPLYSPNIEKIELVKRAKTRRSKLYFVRDKADKELRRKLKDIPLTEEDKKEMANDGLRMEDQEKNTESEEKESNAQEQETTNKEQKLGAENKEPVKEENTEEKK